MDFKKILTGLSILGIGLATDPLSTKFGVQDMCAYEIVDCSQAVYSSCEVIYDEYCSCIRSDLVVDVALLLDGSNSVQTSQYWNDLTIKIANGFGSELESRETGISSSVFVFGDNQVNVYDYDLDISFPSYSSGSSCNVLQSAASYLSDSTDGNKIIIYIAWSSPDVSSCDLSSLSGMKLYVIAIPPNLSLDSLQSSATSAGAQVTLVNYCTDANCLTNLQTSNTAQETAKLIVSFIGDWICSVYTAETSAPTPSPTFLQPPQGFPAPSPTAPPSVVVPPQQATPSPVSKSWFTSSPTTPAPITPSPTTPAPTTPSPTTPSPIIPPQQVTPSPTSKQWWSWSTPSPIIPPQQVTPSPTTPSPTTPSPTTPSPTTPAPTTPSPTTPAPTTPSPTTPAPTTPSPTTPAPTTPSPTTPSPTTPAPITPSPTTPSPTTPSPTTPSPIIPPQQVTPSPTSKQWWSWSTPSPIIPPQQVTPSPTTPAPTTPSPTTPAPTTPSPTTPAPTTPSPTTPSPTTPSPIIPPQQVTPSPTSKQWWSWSTPSPIIPPQQVTPSPTHQPTSWWKEGDGASVLDYSTTSAAGSSIPRRKKHRKFPFNIFH